MDTKAIVEGHPYWHGESLQKAIKESNQERQHLISALIAEHSLNLWYARDGVGKSVLALQACLESTKPSNVFESFEPQHGLKVLYFICERHPSEVFERIRRMEGKIQPNYENIIFDSSLQGLDLQSRIHQEVAVSRVCFLAKKVGEADLVCFDPVYALTSGKMGTDEGAINITQFSRQIQNRLGCANLFLYHPNRGVRNKDTGEREAEDFYGNRFLRSHFTSIYHIKRAGTGTHWECEKDSYHFQQISIDLTYDPETDTSFTVNGRPPDYYIESTKFIALKKDMNKPFVFTEFVKNLGVSHAHGRRLIMRHLAEGLIKAVKNSGKATLYS